jgi:hypothetical protein
MQLTPIGLQLFVPTNHLGRHWAGGIKNDNPSNFELFLMQEGKGKTFGIATHKSEINSFDVDVSQIQKALAAAGCTNFHKEFITFLGHKCCQLNGEYPAQTYIPKRSTMFYIFYAQGLCYEISADVSAASPLPPEKDPDIQEILRGMTFIADAKRP